MKQGMIALGIMISMTLFVSGCVDHAEPATANDIAANRYAVGIIAPVLVV